MKNIYSSYIKSPLTPKKNSIKGVIIHNDAGSMTPSQYLPWLSGRVSSGQITLGFAALYVNRNEALWFSPTDHAEWHAGNQTGNYNYIGFEVCESMPSKTSNATFLQNEEATLKVVAEVMKSYNLIPNRNTVRLHNEFSSTACPHRSWAIHLGNVPYTQANKNKLKDYFIKRINYHMNGSKTETAKKVIKKTTIPKKTSQDVSKKGWSWSGTFQANTTIVVRKGYKSSGAPRLHLNKPVDEASFIKKGDWINFDHLWFADGLWWVKFKYPNGANNNYFFMPLGERNPAVDFSKTKLWGTVTNLNKNSKTSGVIDWKKKGAVKK